MKFGKLAARAPHPELSRLTTQAIASLSSAPFTTSLTQPGLYWPMFCNDKFSCCTAAAQALGSLVMDRALGNPDAAPWPDAAVLSLYSAVTGWDQNNPTVNDNGAVIADVHARMVRCGQDIGRQTPEVLTAALPVNYTNLEHLCRAITNFGWVNCGWRITEAMFHSTDGTWDYVPGSPLVGLHDAILVDIRTRFGKREFKAITWSQEYWVTSACVNASMDEAWICASREHWTRTDGKTPLGDTFDTALSCAERLAA